MTSAQADRLAAMATGVGIGLLTLVVVWLVGARGLTWLLGVPRGPTVALGAAIVAGVIVAIVAVRRLADGVASSAPEP